MINWVASNYMPFNTIRYTQQQKWKAHILRKLLWVTGMSKFKPEKYFYFPLIQPQSNKEKSFLVTTECFEIVSRTIDDVYIIHGAFIMMISHPWILLHLIFLYVTSSCDMMPKWITKQIISTSVLDVIYYKRLFLLIWHHNMVLKGLFL